MNVSVDSILKLVEIHGFDVVKIMRIDLDTLIKKISKQKDFNIKVVKQVIKKCDRQKALINFIKGKHSWKHTEIVKILAKDKKQLDLTELCIDIVPHWYLSSIEYHKLNLRYNIFKTHSKNIDFLIKNNVTIDREYMLPYAETIEQMNYFYKYHNREENPFIQYAENGRRDLMEHAVKLGYTIEHKRYIIASEEWLQTALLMIEFGAKPHNWTFDNKILKHPDTIKLIKLGCTVTYDNLFHMFDLELIEIIKASVDNGFHPKTGGAYDTVKRKSKHDDFYLKVLEIFDNYKPTCIKKWVAQYTRNNDYQQLVDFIRDAVAKGVNPVESYELTEDPTLIEIFNSYTPKVKNGRS